MSSGSMVSMDAAGVGVRPRPPRGRSSHAGGAMEREQMAHPESPESGHGTYSSLNGISCMAATSCIAVGTFTSRKGTTVPLVERYS
jgi:hypothetical protein